MHKKIILGPGDTVEVASRHDKVVKQVVWVDYTTPVLPDDSAFRILKKSAKK